MSITRSRVQRAALSALAAAFLFLTGAATDSAFAQVALEQTPPGRGSLAVFRLEVKIPFGAAESFPRYEIPLAIESEIVPDVESRQTFLPLPPAHLRRVRRDGTAESRPVLVSLRPELPYELLQSMPEHRFQAASNRFVSDWIVVIGDPRASKDYVWPAGTTAQQKEAAGCHSCERPPHLRGPNAERFHEIYSAGRWISVRLEPGIFAGTPYAYLGEERRLEIREPTILSDTVRPTNVLVAAQHPPVATGMLQETTYLHSGEIETSNIDLDAGGRNGWNVVIDRTYRSRTIGATPFGMGGWTSSIFRRLRALPNGSIDYRDAAGENWNFTVDPNTHTYVSPKGLFLKLTRSDRGWTMIDQKWRITTFDELGRLTSESDEFYSPTTPDSGNVIRYIYAPDGMLYRVLDPVGRATTISYDSTTGFVKEIVDWRGRRVSYEYDSQGRLTAAKLPEVGTFTGTNRPTIKYSYEPSAGGSFNDQLELATNLKSITEPHEAATGGNPRVTFSYGAADARDKASGQRWATGETVTFAYNGSSDVSVTDALGQQRQYTLMTPPNDRTHVATLREIGVPVLAMAPFGQLPASLPPGAPAVTAADREWSFTYANGVRTTSKLAGVRETTNAFAAPAGAPGLIIASSSRRPIATATSLAVAGPALPIAAPITHAFTYQSVANGSTYLQAVAANGRSFETPEPHRNNQQPVANNSSIAATRKFDLHGLLSESTATGGTDVTGAAAKEEIEYFDANDSLLHRRSLPRVTRRGDSGEKLVSVFEYPSDLQSRTIDPRGVVTTTDLDAWRRPVRVRVEKAGEPLAIDERYEYDASGRMTHVIRKKGSDQVTTTYGYDPMGRRTSVTTDRIAVADGSVATRVSYDLTNRTVVTRHPGGAVTTTELDALGRTKRTVTSTGSSPIERQFAYDLAGNRVFESDMLTASATAFDAHGRAIATKDIDGTVTLIESDDWGLPKGGRTVDGTGAQTIGQSTYSYTNGGRLSNATTQIDTGGQRATSVAWDGGGRTTAAATSGRASKSSYDSADRLLSHLVGAGGVTELSQTFDQIRVTTHTGPIPQTVTASEASGNSYKVSMDHDTAGEVKRSSVGPLVWTQEFDELGNVTEASVPGKPGSTYEVDARGAIKRETLPDGSTNQFAYHPSGAQTVYTDPSTEPTATESDFIGRPMKRTFADGTSERIEWEGARVKSVTDRQNRKQTFVYDSRGQLREIRDGANTLLDELTYDNAGRLASWKNIDSETGWTDFDLEGNPRKTVQTRFKDGSGLTSSPVVLDEYVQEHRWSEHGERTHWSMPAYAGLLIGTGWTKWVREERDAVGNLTLIGKLPDPSAASAAMLMTGTYRNAGRPDVRTVSPPGGPPIVRRYGYDSETSLMNRLSVEAGGIVIGGSEVEYGRNTLDKESAKLLGVSAGRRTTQWRYDDRRRLTASIFGSVDPNADPNAASPGSAKENLTAADFRSSQQRQSQLGAVAASALSSRGIDTSKVNPPTMTIDERPGGGHKIERVAKGPKIYPFSYGGAEVVDDGRFTYEFDAKGRLLRATEKTTSVPRRRVVYSYNGTGRLIGRRAESATVADPSPTQWQLESRAAILNADGLPAETTFVWDPISDNLITIARAGAATSDPHGGLLKQIIHGGMSYDDPIETTTVDPLSPVTLEHLYPIYDEAGAGSLQAVLNRKSEVVARNLPNDPFGGEDLDLAGAAIDRIAFKGKKTSGGAIESVEVTIRSTEALALESVTQGVRLAAIGGTGALLRVSAAVPSLADAYTVRWTLTGAEWATVTENAVAVSISVTSRLRASAWAAGLPVLPAPEWATATKPVFSSTEFPIEVRESMSSLSSFLARIPTGGEETSTLYEIENLALLGAYGASTAMDDLVSARMHAHPFTEPMTGLNYVRARWYQPLSGSWLSPDPKGYIDSSNLYSYAAANPVANRDASGEGVGDWLAQKYHEAADKIDETAEDIRDGTDDSQWFTRSAAEALQIGSGFLRQGDELGTDLGNAKNFDDYKMAISKVAYNMLPAEEARALIQDWNYLSDAEKARLIAMGISKAASTLALAKGTGELNTALRARGFQPPMRVNLLKNKLAARQAMPRAARTVAVPKATRVSAVSRGGAGPVRVGQIGEKIGTQVTGYPKNTRRIPSASGKKDYRVPDHMNDTGRHIVEDKAVKKQHFSSQLKDDRAYVLRDDGAGRVDVLVDESTVITPQLLREHLNPGSPLKLKTGKLRDQ